MRTDMQIHRDVIDQLAFDPRVNHAEIAVAVKDGVVTLAGSVESYSQKANAERVAEKISGVRAIADDLDVRIRGDAKRSDTEIAHAIVDMLDWNVEIPANRIRAKVEDGFVTLDGVVTWRFQKDAAERTVRSVRGVRGVFNAIAVSPAVTPGDVSLKIEHALRRNAELDAKRIKVETVDGHVTLRGTVRSWAEKQDAWTAAWAAQGVKDVDNQLVISA